MSYEVTLTTDKPEEAQALLWLKTEWEQYAHNKWKDQKPSHDAMMLRDQISEDSWWYNQFIQYVGRARVLGLETQQGRQLLIKSLATLFGCVESAIRVFGDLPEPGHSSGNIHEWKDLPTDHRIGIRRL